MDQADIPSLLSRLNSDEDAMRKMAVFKLQSSINDPSFADVFISSGGLTILRRLIMTTNANTLAYSLQSLSRLLEVDMGWEIFESPGAGELVERVVELIVTHPLVNILRGAMSILVAIVSHPQSSGGRIKIPGAFGFRALKPAVAVYPQFFEMVVSQLNSADHLLCANALMLLNALMRDSITNDNGQGKDNVSKSSGTGEEWPKFIKRLQDLGVIKAAYNLMQSSALQDLSHPLLDFQSLTKVMLGKWKEVKVDLERPEHRRALKGLHLASAPEKKDLSNGASEKVDTLENGDKKGSRKHNPEKWRRLGFETESPAWEFEATGFLGMMDLTDYRCPIARASLIVTSILYDHFEVDKSDAEDAKTYLVLDGVKNYDKIFRPLLLQWSRLHSASLQAFFRLGKATGAEQDDFIKVAELVRFVEEELAEFEYSKLRKLQMELLELTFEDEWGQHLQQVRDELKHEALLFVKEQRIRCLLEGAWFPRIIHPKTVSEEGSSSTKSLGGKIPTTSWRYVKLSHNRRYLHYFDFDHQLSKEPTLDQLLEKIDLSTISSVVSNVSASHDDGSSISSSSTPKDTNPSKANTTTKITINSYVTETKAQQDDTDPAEKAILTLMPPTHSLASEWLDGLLMLLNQAAITSETNKLVSLVSEYGLKIRLLNVRLDEGNGYGGPQVGQGKVPSREGLDEDYYYEV
ncbi:uncharacterized protein EAF02_008144 [Botrytis sinoallii]|uniref:uncharacterized protein n=1 Tax=Botrytis sinoallii TaxID=1463999 RepID=UPI0018FFEFA1|nr:uncharacterized protein EAF02_008144 [Botrytis sinoallii]KAF7876924.1 hypothetical protein EAF02_008144 [Botrytis sinoallii]